MPDWIRIAIALVATSILFTFLIAIFKHQDRDKHSNDWEPDFEFAFKVVGLVWIGGSTVVGFLLMWSWAVGGL